MTAVRVPVQAHPGLMVASMPWLGGRDFKRLCAWMPHAAIALVVTRDGGAGRVMIGRDGLPRLHYRPDRHDQESMMQVTAAGCAGLKTAAQSVHLSSGWQHAMQLRQGSALLP